MPDQAANPDLTIRAIRARPVEVPLNFVLGTTQDVLRRMPLLLVDLETEEGVTGRSWLFCYVPAVGPAIASLIGEIERVTKGERLVPDALWAKLNRRFTLIGVQGIVRMAMAGFDTAAWDALAIAAGQPLARFIGATPRPIPAYNSCGLGLMDDLGALAAEAETLLAMGKFNAVKLRLGYPTLQQDIAAVHAVRLAHRRQAAADGRLQSGADLGRGARTRPRARRGRRLPGWRSRSAMTTMPAPRG